MSTRNTSMSTLQLPVMLADLYRIGAHAPRHRLLTRDPIDADWGVRHVRADRHFTIFGDRANLTKIAACSVRKFRVTSGSCWQHLARPEMREPRAHHSSRRAQADHRAGNGCSGLRGGCRCWWCPSGIRAPPPLRVIQWTLPNRNFCRRGMVCPPVLRRLCPITACSWICCVSLACCHSSIRRYRRDRDRSDGSASASFCAITDEGADERSCRGDRPSPIGELLVE
jgi:hypothetical protein